MKTPDGGPAFPNRYVDKSNPGINHTVVIDGMSLRDYFIAHAPAEPQPWFEPKMPPYPKPDPAWHWCEGCKMEDNCDHTAQCDQLREHQNQCRVWKVAAEKAKWVQWPAAWADEMLKAREHANS